jgi:hypothetical protein
MKKETASKPPFEEPAPRLFSQWCEDFGLECRAGCPEEDKVLSYDEFCYSPEMKLYKVKEGHLYGFWKNYQMEWSECRTVQEWLDEFDLELVDPTPEELNDLNLFLGYDPFHQWSSGIVTGRTQSADFNLWDWIKDKMK